MTEGVTLLLLSVQTGLIELQVIHRGSIVVASVLQSMLEIADPIALALGASRDKSLWKHLQAVSLCLFLLLVPALSLCLFLLPVPAVSLCLFLLLVPVYMAYIICQFFHMDFWLLIISSSILTSLQVLGTPVHTSCLAGSGHAADLRAVRGGAVVPAFGGAQGRGDVRCERGVPGALCVGAYGLREALFGEWTVMGSTIIFIHSYYNVWLRAQLGWQSFLLRRDTVRKIHSMPTAPCQQLHTQRHLHHLLPGHVLRCDHALRSFLPRWVS
ncbi:hypothetical protein COCON_G00040440 [Conger conger]|uniref:TRC8-like N-terminal domain-containing protein n=1 Tax=Conger conger TaxID=82655 RepID=A0A9Q1DTH5_CONCO|nr:hypothetical protein COCON_G00040440 [Conger conger]